MDQQDTPQPLQFEYATQDGATPGGAACVLCQAALHHEYHDLNGSPVCLSCREQTEAEHQAATGWAKMPKALLYGGGAALAGCIVYYLSIKLLNLELGLVAIAVGWITGSAVMKGTDGWGGRRFQILAVGLTYFAITFAYLPLMIEAGLKQERAKAAEAGKAGGKSGPSSGEGVARNNAPPRIEDSPASERPSLLAGIGLILAIVLAAPFLAGFSNFLGWIIIAIGLWEAWKRTAARPFVTSGPYQFGEAAPASAAASESQS